MLIVPQFDDIPTISRLDNFTDPNGTFAQPVPFPHHRFFFSNGFDVVSSPAGAFEPASGSQMVHYNTSESATAQIGLAQLRENSCFRFNFLGFGLGCVSSTETCVFEIAGLQWNGVDEVIQANRTIEITGCPSTGNCSLSHQVLDSAAAVTFTNLTAINITLTVGGQPQDWWGDDLQIAWTDNSCDTASCRSLVPNNIMLAKNPRAGHLRARRPFRWSARHRNAHHY